jgi:surface protein
MFYDCLSLKELNLSNFNTNNVTNMNCMFFRCSSLKELNLSYFNINNVTEMDGMFFGCPNQLQNTIRIQYKNIKEIAFKQY